MKNKYIDNYIIKEIRSFAGGLGSMFAGLVQGQYGKELTDNIYGGQRIGKNAVENNLVYQVGRNLDIKELVDRDLPTIGKHTFVVSQPDDSEDFTPEKMVEQGLDHNKFIFIDLSNGKKSIISSAFDVNGNLIAEINNKTDSNVINNFFNNYDDGFSPEIRIVSPKNGISDTNFIYNILKNTQNYINNVEENPVSYYIIPEVRKSTYNCNSFSNSLLNYSGANKQRNNDFRGFDPGRNTLLPKDIFEQKGINSY